jgi:hypothetical protein
MLAARAQHPDCTVPRLSLPNHDRAEFSADSPLFLTNAFLRPAFSTPRSFGLIPLSLQITPDSTTLILEALSARAAQLSELIHSVESPPPLPSTEKLSKILPDRGKSALFTADDLEILNGLVESANLVCGDFPVKPPAEPSAVARGQEYQTFAFTSPSIQDIYRVRRRTRSSGSCGRC